MKSTGIVRSGSERRATRMARITRITALVGATVLAAAGCDPAPTPPFLHSTSGPLASEAERDSLSRIGRTWGAGTAGVQQRILDGLGAQPTITLHVLVDSANPTPDTLMLRDEAAGTRIALVPQPAWTLRDVSSIRLDPQRDSSVLVVLLLARTPRIAPYLDAALRAPVHGALVINGEIFEVGTTRLFPSKEDVPASLASFPAAQATRIAAQLRAALVH